MAIITCLLLALYVEAPLFLSSSFYIPGVVTVFSVPVLAVFNRGHIYRADLEFVAQIGLVLLLSALLSVGPSFIAHKLFSGVPQTTVSIVAGVLLVKTMDRLGSRDTERLLFCLSVLLLVGASLEVMGVLRGVSDAFRGVVYGQGEMGYQAYSHTSRDTLLAGFNRPNFFTSEPSLLAIGFSVFSNAWLLLASGRKNYLLFILATLSMLFLTASPILFISIVMSVCTMVYHGAHLRRGFLHVFSGLAFFAISGSVFWFLGGGVVERLADRLAEAVPNINTYAVTSENLRMVFPFLTMLDVLRVSPLFGVGVSGQEAILLYSTLPYGVVETLGNNNLATLFIYLGILGATFFLFSFYRYFRRFLIGSQLLLLTVLVGGVTQMMGGFESPRFWGFVFMFVGTLKKTSTPLSVSARRTLSSESVRLRPAIASRGRIPR